MCLYCDVCVCVQSFNDATPKKQRDDVMKTYKESLSTQQQEAEQTLSGQHKYHLDLELRKFQRRKRLQRHEKEKSLLQEVSQCAHALCTVTMRILG